MSMEEVIEKRQQIEQLKRLVLGWQESAKTQVLAAMGPRMEELVKRVREGTVAELEKELAKQNGKVQAQVQTLEALCKEMEEKAKEKVKLEREKAKGKARSDVMAKFYTMMG